MNAVNVEMPPELALDAVPSDSGAPSQPPPEAPQEAPSASPDVSPVGSQEGQQPSDTPQPVEAPSATKSAPESSKTKEPPLVEIFDFADATRDQIVARLKHDVGGLLSHKALSHYCPIAILDPHTSISTYELDQIYQGLEKRNPKRDKDVLLLLLSRGGSIEPAYQISKLCKSFAHEKFIVCAPRQAKSAATLICLGADEVHMGPLSQLGPIDPQIDGMPALGVAHAIDTLAATAARYPNSAEMLARYLQAKLSVPQIGYFERVAESAVQYAERLLAAKAALLPKPPSVVAKELVHEYKDHGFVIDVDEARSHLGKSWIITDSPLAAFAETFYSMMNVYGMFLRPDRKIALIGSLHPEDLGRTLYLILRD
jgi:hypothetical protein